MVNKQLFQEEGWNLWKEKWNYTEEAAKQLKKEIGDVLSGESMQEEGEKILTDLLKRIIKRKGTESFNMVLNKKEAKILEEVLYFYLFFNKESLKRLKDLVMKYLEIDFEELVEWKEKYTLIERSFLKLITEVQGSLFYIFTHNFPKSFIHRMLSLLDYFNRWELLKQEFVKLMERFILYMETAVARFNRDKNIIHFFGDEREMFSEDYFNLNKIILEVIEDIKTYFLVTKIVILDLFWTEEDIRRLRKDFFVDVKIEGEKEELKVPRVLKNVFWHILKNSIDYWANKVEIWTDDEEGYFKIYIKDNGKGIGQNLLKKIKDRLNFLKEIIEVEEIPLFAFMRVRGDRSPGIWIWLLLSQLELLKYEVNWKRWYLEIDSEEGKWTTVVINLPEELTQSKWSGDFKVEVIFWGVDNNNVF